VLDWPPGQPTPTLTPTIGPGTSPWDAAADFTLTHGAESWYYQYLDSGGYPSMVMDGTKWTVPGAPNCALVAWGGRPSTYSVVRKWFSPISGWVRITGVAAKSDTACGDGVTARILKNAQTLWSKDLAYNDATGYSYDLLISVVPGDSIRFILDQRSNDACDATFFHPYITQVSAPSATPTPTRTHTPTRTPSPLPTATRRPTRPWSELGAVYLPIIPRGSLLTPTATPSATATPTPSSTPSATPAVTPSATPTLQQTPWCRPGGVCVSLHLELHDNLIWEPDEPLLAGGRVEVLSLEGWLLDSYTTDGLHEPYCFGLPSDSLVELRAYSPPGYTGLGPQSLYVMPNQSSCVKVAFAQAVAATTATPTPSPTPGFVWRSEAEAGLFTAPMRPYLDALAYCGQHVSSHVGNAGSVTYNLDVPTDGAYYLWARVRGGDWTRNSFVVSLGTRQDVHYEVPQFGGEWVFGWDQVRAVDQPVEPYALTAGSQTLVIAGREYYAELDALVLTSDASFVPSEEPPAACPTLTPTPTATVTPEGTIPVLGR
ncbi:MAG: hypothetical protein GX557_08450, partial [Chloroflexi bacterium]|nr:hypothetical protein [Chloroflexota bacterium]